MAVSTSMGPAAPGSRLERRCEGKRILNHLITTGWRGPDLGEEVGVDVKKLCHWRHGKGQPPSPDELEALRLYVRN